MSVIKGETCIGFHFGLSCVDFDKIVLKSADISIIKYKIQLEEILWVSLMETLNVC